MKINDLIEQYSGLITKKAEHNRKHQSLTTLFSAIDTGAFSDNEKTAFIPNPEIAQQLQNQQAPPQQAPPPQPPQQAAPPPQQAAPPPQQAAPPPQQAAPPPQQAAPQGGAQTLWDEVSAALQQLPPELQQQMAPLLQQLEALPPEQREQQLGGILQQLTSQMSGGGAESGADPSMVAQAGLEDILGGMPPQQEQAPSNEQPAFSDADSAEASAIEAKNELDNVRVNLSVRELLDLVGKGSATASLLKVKQLADQHNQKMDAVKQKAENEKQQQVQEQDAQQQSMMGGGIYPQAMNASM
jgi:hypothetical protein